MLIKTIYLIRNTASNIDIKKNTTYSNIIVNYIYNLK